MSGHVSDTGVESIQEEVARSMDAKKEQELKDKVFYYLTILNFLNNRNDDNAFLPQIKKCVHLNAPGAIGELLIENEEKISKIFGLFNFLRSNEESLARCRHDLANVASGAESILSFVLVSFKNGEDIDFELLKMFLDVWDRYFVTVEDILLRIISKEEISPEFQVGTNIDVLKGILIFFNTRELKELQTFSTLEDSAYKKIGDIEIKLVSNEEWNQLKLKLGDRQIGGNNGLVGNFELNALRNALKDRVEATEVTQTVEIKGDWLVVRIVDNGKGIRPKFLQKGYKEKDKITGEEKEIYIFHEGASGTGSTGKGLADFDTRLASVGGELYVSTKTVSDGMVRFQYGSTPEKANEVEYDESLEHGTVFEIRLPIIQKQK